MEKLKNKIINFCDLLDIDLVFIKIKIIERSQTQNFDIRDFCLD